MAGVQAGRRARQHLDLLVFGVAICFVSASLIHPAVASPIPVLAVLLVLLKRHTHSIRFREAVEANTHASFFTVPLLPVAVTAPTKSATPASAQPKSVTPVLLIPTERRALDELRSRLPSLVDPWIDQCDDATLLRFLRGHDLNIEVALHFVVKTACWRREFGTDSLVSAWETDQSPEAELLKTRWPFGIIAKDPEGRPVQLFRLVTTDLDCFIIKCGLTLILKHNVWRFERNLLDGNGNGEAIIILDLGNNLEETDRVITSFSSMRLWIKALMSYLKLLTSVVDPYYPETYSLIIFTRAPGPFWAVWKVAQLLINENTRKKVVISTSDDPKSMLLDLLPETCIPTFFGGGADCSQLPKGGRL